MEEREIIYISNIEDLQNIGKDPSYPLKVQYELTQDIDASDTINWNDGEGFAPIGNDYNQPFTGVFDGKGHKIRNLYINRPSLDYVGLFGYVDSGGQVKNVGLENVQVVGSWRVGGLVGCNYGTVSQSYSTGSVGGNKEVGGLVGSNYGTVSQSYSTGSVGWNKEVGGLVGCNWYGAVDQSYSTGSVEGNQYVGGLVGNNDVGTVGQSYSTGSVAGSYDVGGLVGGNVDTVSRSYSTVSVAGNSSVGVIVVYKHGGTVSQSYWDIETSGQSTSDWGKGRTTAQMKQQATYVGWDFVNVWAIEENVTYPYLRALGQPVEPVIVEKEIWSLSDLNKIGRDREYPMDGHYTLMVDIDASATINWDGGKGFKPIVLVGRFDGGGHVIRNLYINRLEEDRVGLFSHVYGEVKNIGVENVQVVGYEYVGGLVGRNYGTVSQSYSTGSVVGSYKVGGLVGYSGGTVSQSYSTGSVQGGKKVGGLVGLNYGTVSQSYSTGSVAGGGSVGGLVGRNEGGTVTQSYSTGSVSGKQNVGGLVGVNDGGTVTDSYWDKETYGQTVSAGGEGKTTAEMKQQATYVGWDFVNVWAIEENVTYPYLRALGQPVEPVIVEKEIWSLSDLNKIGRDREYPMDGHYTLMVDIDASATINWDGGKGFKPITLVGRFDGNGHVIRNLYINRLEEDRVGLFSHVYGEVKNIGVENVQVVGYEYVGGLVGRNYGTVSQSYSTGSVVGSYKVGGLVGLNRGTVSQSYSTGSVSGVDGVGGLVGDNYSGTVSQSYSTGSVAGGGSVGGLVGRNEGGTVTQSYSTGSVSGKQNVGGLVGVNDGGTVIDSYWDKETSGQTTSNGGEGKTTAEMKQQATFVGWDFTTVWDIKVNVTYPYLQALGQPILPPAVVNKEIWSLSDLNKIGRDWEYPMDGRYILMADIDASDTINWNEGKGFKPIILVGRFDGNGHVIRNLYINRPEEDEVGLFGRVYGEVKNIGVENVQVVGGNDVGGLVGDNYSGTMSQSYSTGSVQGGKKVGGLVGRNYGDVSESYSTGSVSGVDGVGGLVGDNYSGTVRQSYSTGLVSGGDLVGGLVGYKNGGSTTQSYWDKQTSGQSSSEGGTRKTTAQMKKKATYVGWDFVNVWDIIEGVSYPYLRVLGPTQGHGDEGEGAKEG